MTSKPHWLIRKQVRIWIAQLHHVGASFVSLAPTYFISQSALTPLLLLSNCDPLCWARSWWAALRAAFFVSDTNIGFNRPCHVGASFVSLAPTYFISQSALTPLLLLSNCDLLCWARSWWAALRAAFFVSDRNISLNRPSQKERHLLVQMSFLFCFRSFLLSPLFRL